MERLIALNSTIRKRMPPKRSGAPLFSEKPRKIRKVIIRNASNGVVVGVKRPGNVRSQLNELKRTLEQKDKPQAMLLLRKIATTPYLPQKLTVRLLEFCVKTGNKVVAAEFLTTQKIDLKTFDGGKLLLDAVVESQDDIAAMLMRHGADLSDRRDADNRTLLHVALRSYKIKNNAKREELVRMLIRCGADVNARDNVGYSVLHDAIVYEHCSSKLVEELLDHGARLTIDKSCSDLNDIFSATCYKPALLPRLIEHQARDGETRNERGVMAIDYLISKQYTGAKTVDAMEMVKRILELGVPVNTMDPFAEHRVGQRACSLLSTALFHKKRKAIRLLLQHGADPHQKDELGRTPLFQATAYKSHSWASRWLIQKGASIHARNDDGRYPIHAACSSESLRNIHLLLNLGADLNVTDDEGCTPFSYTQETINFNEAHYLVIKHLALIVAKGGGISDQDVTKINHFTWSRHHFNKCTKQLDKMKVKKIWRDVPYFSLLTKDMYSMMQLMKNSKFVKSFKRSDEKRNKLFSNYSYMLLHSFEIAKMRYKKFVAERKKLKYTFGEDIPDGVIDKITYYLCLDKLKRCQCNYYMTLHASLKHTKADKAKIL